LRQQKHRGIILCQDEVCYVGGKEEVAATKAMMMAATTAVGMLSRWRLQEQALDGAIRVGGGRRRMR
jgi:hypothetical protein